MPWATVKVKWGQARDEVARRLATERYDLVWVLDHSAWPAVPADVRARMVVDLDDLEDEKIFHRMSNRAENGVDGARERFPSPWSTAWTSNAGAGCRPRWPAGDAIVLAGVDERRRSRTRSRERCRTGTARSMGWRSRAARPTARPRWFTSAGCATARTSRPSPGWPPACCRSCAGATSRARLRVVGDYGAEIAALASVPGIEIVGHVDQVRDELLGRI